MGLRKFQDMFDDGQSIYASREGELGTVRYDWSGKALPIAMAWVLGYGIAIYLGWGWLGYAVCCAALIALAAVLAFRLPGRRVLGFALLVLAAAGFYGGHDARNVSALASAAGERAVAEAEAVVRGMIVSPVEVDGDRAMFDLAAESVTIAGGEALGVSERMRVTIRLQRQPEQDIAAGWRRGDRVTLRSVLERPSPARNFGGFDYRRYLHEQRIHWLLTAKGTDAAAHESVPLQFSAAQLLRWTDGLRAALAARIDRVFPADQAPFMKGMLIGMSNELDPERYDRFSALGLTHIIAISGLNVSIFVGALIWLMKRLRLTRETYLLVSILLLPAYILLTGASPSIVRAGMMAMIALWAGRQRWGKDALHILCLVAVVLLVWNPYFIHDVSFQLSFAVTAGIIWGVPRVTALLPARFPRLTAAVVVTVVAQLASFPLTIYYFSQFSLLSPLANFLLIPVFSLIVYPLGLLALLLGFIWLPLGETIGLGISLVNDVAFAAMEQLEYWKGALIWPTPTLSWIAAYYGLLLIVYSFAAIVRTYGARAVDPGALAFAGKHLMLYRSGAKTGLAITIATFMLLLFIGYSPDRWSRYGSVQFIDVGQGDAILIRTPEGRHILVDGGGTISFRKQGEEWKERKDPYEVGRKLLVPLLKKRGVHELDLLVLTHQDADHSGGLSAVLRDIPVRAFLFNGTLKRAPGVESLFHTALDRSVPLYGAESGQTFDIDASTRLTVLSPAHPTLSSSGAIRLLDVQNESSVVFLLAMSGRTWLFTGDMGAATEKSLLAQWKGENTTLQHSTPLASIPPIDVLKVAHHGSKNSSTSDWLAWWRPQAAVISVGAKNVYGHPSKDALTRLQAAGASVLRTDIAGEIQCIVRDGNLEWRAVLLPEFDAKPNLR